MQRNPGEGDETYLARLNKAPEIDVDRFHAQCTHAQCTIVTRESVYIEPNNPVGTRNALIEATLRKATALLDQAAAMVENVTPIAGHLKNRGVVSGGVMTMDAPYDIRIGTVRWVVAFTSAGVPPNSPGTMDVFQRAAIQGITGAFNQMLAERGGPALDAPYSGFLMVDGDERVAPMTQVESSPTEGRARLGTALVDRSVCPSAWMRRTGQ